MTHTGNEPFGPGPLLGIDYGSVRIGIARSDSLQMLASPVDVIPVRRHTRDELVEAIIGACPPECAGVVVGWPDDDDIRTEPVRQAITALVALLEQRLSLPCVLVSESFSSREAQELLHAGGKRLKPGQPIDAHAAAVILQRHLDGFQHIKR